MAYVCVLLSVCSATLLFFDLQPNACLEMYTRVHNVGALSELATNPFRRLALFNCMSLAGDSVHGRLRRCLSVDILLIFFFYFAGSSWL